MTSKTYNSAFAYICFRYGALPGTIFLRSLFLKKNRKYALVIVLIFAAIITPPDIASQVIVAIPVLVLYQVSILISKIVLRNQKRKENNG